MASPAPVKNDPERFLNEYEVAEWLGISVASLRRWRILHTGPPYRKIGHLVRYQRSEVQTWIEAQPRG